MSSPFKFRSIRFRLTFWYAAILTAGLGLFGGLIWLSLRDRLIGEIDNDLKGSASRFETYFKAEAAEESGGHLRGELREFCQALPPASYVDLRGSDGFAFRYPPAPIAAKNLRTLRSQFIYAGTTYDLDVGASIREVHHTLELLRVLLWSFLPGVIAIACLGGAWLSGRALRPVQAITAAAKNISIENLSDRLPVAATGDEIASLTEVLNGMLARLESAVKTLSQFVADASHELRTPLAVIRTTADLALRRTRPAESYRDALQQVSAEGERMSQLVEDLLTLARSDGQLDGMPLAPLDVREVLADVESEMRGVAELRGLRIRSSFGEQAAVISGHRAGLHRLFLVLLDNALKYSPDGGEVIIRVESTDTQIGIEIQDFGCGIRESDVPHIFKRFYQADPSRNDGGHGLGLALAEKIVRAHHAEIVVRSVEGAGSTFRVTFMARIADPAPTALSPFSAFS
jgi:signal transduction histidine kinase